MQTISAAAVATYYLAIQSAEYYLRSEFPGRIIGSAALALGISGVASRNTLAHLFAGYSPDGKTSYVQQQKYSDVHRGCGKVRQKAAGWDATWSVPKSVSVFWATAPVDVRKVIEEIVLNSVKKSVAYLEENAAFTRTGQGGARRERVTLIVATFMHATSRASDCQLHVHGVVFNIGLREDGKTGTIVSKPLYDHQKASGAVFRAALANELRTRFRLPLVRTRHGFEIEGIPDELIRHFSKRRRDIEQQLVKLGEYTPKDAARVAIATRTPKTQEPPLQTLMARWREEAATFGFTHDLFIQSRRESREKQAIPRFSSAINLAKEKLNATRDVFLERELVQRTLDASVSSGLDVDLVIKAAKERLRDRREFVPLDGAGRGTDTTNREATYIMRTTLNDLADVERRIKRLSRDRSFVIRNHVVEELITRFSTPRNPVSEEIKHHASQLSKAARKQPTQSLKRKQIKEQAKVALDPRWAVFLRGLVQEPGRVIVMEDWPSPQRDLAIKAAARAWGQAGKSVIACTRLLKNAKQLQNRTGIPTMSVRRFQLQSKPTLAFQLRWHAVGLVRTALGAPASRLSPPPLDESKILLVDRAHQLRPREIELILRESERHGAKVVFLTTPPHGRVHGLNPATSSLLNRFAIPTWWHRGRTWKSQPPERTNRIERHQAPQVEI